MNGPDEIVDDDFPDLTADDISEIVARYKNTDLDPDTEDEDEEE